MNPRIIYPTDDGGVAIIIPSADALIDYGIHAIADKDVPEGRTYTIVDAASIPEDRTFRAAWEADMTHPDGTGSASNTFPEMVAT